MPELLQYLEANWWVATVALLVLIGIARWIFAATRKTTIERDESDEKFLEQGAKRNQALIDSTPAAETPLATAPIIDEEPLARTTATPAPIAAPASTPTPSTSVDDVGQLKGLGPKLVTMLADLGVTSIAQIAVWDEAEIDKIDAQLGRFEGRIRRDNWVLQAQLLQSGDIAAYEEKFGKK